MNENKTIEAFFQNFLDNGTTGDVSEAMSRISADLDAAIEAGDADKAIGLAGDFEWAATRLGFYYGLMAGLELGQAKQGAA